jgi:general secretion pathway protein A
MFLKYYGLREQPFGVTPDPRFLYLTPAHREALSSLFYGIDEGRGFMALIAKPGMGKTTLLVHLLERYRATAQTAYIFQTQCTSREFMRFLLAEIGSEVAHEQDLVMLHEEFNRRLLREAREGRRFIVIVDEAQNLETSVLETIRLLSDFETPRAKLLQIVLAGQPELADKLGRPALSQLRQRISVLSSLRPLPQVETERYMEHRLRVAGFAGGSPFTPQAKALIADVSEGIPRNINNICFAALSLGYSRQQRMIDADVIREVASGLDLSSLSSELKTSSTPQTALLREIPRPEWSPDDRPYRAQVPEPKPAAQPHPIDEPDPSVNDAQTHLQEISKLLRNWQKNVN